MLEACAQLAPHELATFLRGQVAQAAAEAPPWASFQLTGDILLTHGSGWPGFLSCVGQSLVEGVWVRASHAHLVAAPGFYLDSAPRHGVVLMRADDMPMRTARSGDDRRHLIAVMRHPTLAASADARRDLLEAALVLLGQAYNFRFMLKRRADQHPRNRTAFCSEAVAKAFATIGLPLLPGEASAAVLPHRLLERLADHGWLDVTASYGAWLDQPAGAPDGAVRLAAPA